MQCTGKQQTSIIFYKITTYCPSLQTLHTITSNRSQRTYVVCLLPFQLPLFPVTTDHSEKQADNSVHALNMFVYVYEAFYPQH